MSIELRNRVNAIEARLRELEAKPETLAALEARIVALESRPRPGRPAKNG